MIWSHDFYLEIFYLEYPAMLLVKSYFIANYDSAMGLGHKFSQH